MATRHTTAHVTARSGALVCVLAFSVVIVAVGCGPRPGTQSPGTAPAAGGDEFARVQQIEASAEYRAAVDRFVSERKGADAALRAMSLDAPAILRVVVADSWVGQPEAAREQWLLALADAFRKLRANAGIPADERFLPTVRVYVQDGGIVAEAWRQRVRHYR